MPPPYPLMLDVTDRLVVIVGGGNVAVRKVIGLLDAGATRLRVVSPSFDEKMPDAVERVNSEYRPHHLKGAALVFAATNDSAVNERVAADARALGILVNRSDSDDTDFTTPAVLREKSVVVTVSTGSPAIAAKIRDQIQKTLDQRWLALAEAMKILRPEVLAAKLPEPVRRQLLRDLASEEFADMAMQGNIAAIRAKIEQLRGKSQ